MYKSDAHSGRILAKSALKCKMQMKFINFQAESIRHQRPRKTMAHVVFSSSSSSSSFVIRLFSLFVFLLLSFGPKNGIDDMRYFFSSYITIGSNFSPPKYSTHTKFHKFPLPERVAAHLSFSLSKFISPCIVIWLCYWCRNPVCRSFIRALAVLFCLVLCRICTTRALSV